MEEMKMFEINDGMMSQDTRIWVLLSIWQTTESTHTGVVCCRRNSLSRWNFYHQNTILIISNLMWNGSLSTGIVKLELDSDSQWACFRVHVCTMAVQSVECAWNHQNS